MPVRGFRFDLRRFRRYSFQFNIFLMRHTISVVVQNRFGVLTRIAGLFSGRGFNIDTLNVGPTQNDKISRMTIVVVGNDQVLEQVVKQLKKLVDVLEVYDFKDGDVIDRELILLKVKANSSTRPESCRSATSSAPKSSTCSPAASPSR